MFHRYQWTKTLGVFEVLGHRICFKISREACVGTRMSWSILWMMSLHTDVLYSVWNVLLGNRFYNFIVFPCNFSHHMVKSNLLKSLIFCITLQDKFLGKINSE